MDEVTSVSSHFQESQFSETSFVAAIIIRELFTVIRKNVVALIAAPLIAGTLVAAYASFRTKEYTSLAYLRLDENSARAADAIMSSVPVLVQLLTEFKVDGATAEDRRRELDSKRSISVAPNQNPRTSTLFRLSVTNADPAMAQAINAAFIAAWLQATIPPPINLRTLNDEIARTEQLIPQMSALLDVIKKASPPVLHAENTLSEDALTPAIALITKIDQANKRIEQLKLQTLGASQDAVFSPPNLPDAPNPSHAVRWGLLAAIAAEILLLMFFWFRHSIEWRQAE
ncbi:hypothetical protein [Bradyrhizobium sp. C9]|uniref:hypothetical protein n=1 Tax=Bradyrhizobium sp. C9 TaxID=142585 RepID=UPI000BE901DF|nr:hypothetical protein [Bradyrhizobium sp. C9]PDT74105.1 hypothetical protein CO675_26915 [Bradyrhizobium sp. C9]